MVNALFEDPVQVGCAFDGTGRGDCRNMLDFIDAAMAPNGSFVVSYTEGCVEACKSADHPSQSNEQQVAIAGLRGFDLLPD